MGIEHFNRRSLRHSWIKHLTGAQVALPGTQDNIEVAKGRQR